MQLQYLKRVRSSLNLWPPVDTARYGLRDSPRRSRPAHRCAPHRQSADNRVWWPGPHRFLHEWTEPPTIEAVHVALRTMLGKRIWEVGQVAQAFGLSVILPAPWGCFDLSSSRTTTSSSRAFRWTLRKLDSPTRPAT